MTFSCPNLEAQCLRGLQSLQEPRRPLLSPSLGCFAALCVAGEAPQQSWSHYEVCGEGVSISVACAPQRLMCERERDASVCGGRS